jgi:hypothetical protein
MHARAQPLGAARARDHRRAGVTRQRRKPPGMIEMRLGAQNKFNVFGVEPQLADIGEDRGRRLRQGAVDQHQPRARVDQRDTQPTETNKIARPEDSFGRQRRQPLLRALDRHRPSQRVVGTRNHRFARLFDDRQRHMVHARQPDGDCHHCNHFDLPSPPECRLAPSAKSHVFSTKP